MLVRAERRPIRVVIADDHEMVRIGLTRLFDATPGIELVGDAADGAEAIALAAERSPDVVLMDLQMPRVDGIEATRRISRAPAAPRVVVLTSFSDAERVTQALDSGAVGYLLKDSEAEELVAGVRAAAVGAAPLAPRAALAVVRERRSAGTLESLTERERQVLALVGRGATNRQIAQRLGITPRTVTTHLTHIFRRIGVSERGEATAWARRHGLVEDEGPTAR